MNTKVVLFKNGCYACLLKSLLPDVSQEAWHKRMPHEHAQHILSRWVQHIVRSGFLFIKFQ